VRAPEELEYLEYIIIYRYFRKYLNILPGRVFVRRRKLMQSMAVGAASIGSAVAVTGSKTDDAFKQKTQKAVEIKNKKGIEAAKDFLRDNGYRTGSKTIENSFSLGGEQSRTDDEVGTQKITDPQDGGISITLFPMQNDGKFYVSVDNKYDLRVKCMRGRWANRSAGEAPPDAVGIAWNTYQNEYFDLADGGGENAMTTSKNTSWNEGVHDPSRGRTAFKANDRAVQTNWEDSLDSCTVYKGLEEREENNVYGTGCGVYLEPTGDWEPEERVVYVAYTHSWSKFGFSPSMQFASTGPAIQFKPSWQAKEVKITADEDGTDLAISQADCI
jgi:hypothetical protein